MKITDLFGKKNVTEEIQKSSPYRVVTRFVPYRLRANVRNSASLSINIKNMTREPLMTSLVVEVPKQLSFDSTGLAKAKEIRFGDLAANEERDQRIDIYGDTGTDKGEYTISIVAFAHYRDYGHILNAMRKTTALEVV